MILKNVLLMVKDMERSRHFYQDVLGLSVRADFGKKVIFTGGVVIEEDRLWENALGITASYGGNNVELYFEAPDIESIRERLEGADHKAEYLTGQEEPVSDVIRFYDPDRHIIEVRRGKIC